MPLGPGQLLESETAKLTTLDSYTRHVKAVLPPERVAELGIVDQLARQLTQHVAATAVRRIVRAERSAEPLRPTP